MVKTRLGNSGRVSSVSPAKEHPLIQAIYKGVEIEMEMHQQTHGHWKCDFTLIKHPERSVTIEHAAAEFPPFDLAREHALEKARAASGAALAIPVGAVRIRTAFCGIERPFSAFPPIPA